MRQNVLLLLLAAATPALAQQPVAQFSTHTDSVEIDVVARDGAGAYVRDLSPADFVVFEDGQRRDVDLLTYETAVPQGGRGMASEGAASIDVPLLTTAGAGSRARNLRLIVVFFDFAAMDPDAARRAGDAARVFVERQLGAEDRVALVSWGMRLQIEQDFTADRGALVQALDRIRHFNRDQLPGSVADAAGDDSEGAGRAESGGVVFANAGRLRALQSVAAALGRVPERKAVVYFGAGMGGEDNQAQVRATVNAAVRSHVQIYPVDMRGLMAAPPVGEADRPSISGTAVYSGQAVMATSATRAASRATEVALASETGGRAYFDSNDFSGAFDQVHRDTAEYYLLGYANANPSRDGRFHRIEVRSRRRGIHLEYRRGYYADIDLRHATAEERTRRLDEALAAELMPTDVPIEIWSGVFASGGPDYFVPVSIQIPGAALGDRDTGNDARVEVAGEVVDGRGQSLGRVHGRIEIPRMEAGDITRTNFQYSTGFVLPPGAYRVRFVVAETAGGRLGSFESPLAIPGTADPLRVSTIAIGSKLQRAGDAASARPLRWGDEELVVKVTPTFLAREDLHVYFEVSDAITPDAVVRILRDAQPVVTLTAGDLSIHGVPARHATAYRADVPLAGLPPGSYACEVTIADPVRHGSAVRSASFTIAPRP